MYWDYLILLGGISVMAIATKVYYWRQERKYRPPKEKCCDYCGQPTTNLRYGACIWCQKNYKVGK